MLLTLDLRTHTSLPFFKLIHGILCIVEWLYHVKSYGKRSKKCEILHPRELANHRPSLASQ